jgi:hypothetical protein
MKTCQFLLRTMVVFHRTRSAARLAGDFPARRYP